MILIFSSEFIIRGKLLVFLHKDLWLKFLIYFDANPLPFFYA